MGLVEISFLAYTCSEVLIFDFTIIRVFCDVQVLEDPLMQLQFWILLIPVMI